MSEQIRLCDDNGMISNERVEPGSHGTEFDPDLTYLGLLNNLRAHTALAPVAEPLHCTGSAHLAGMVFQCTSPAHAGRNDPNDPYIRVGQYRVPKEPLMPAAEDREDLDVIWKVSVPITAPGSVLHEVPKTARFVSVGWDPAYPEGMAGAVWFRVPEPHPRFTGLTYKDEWELDIVGTGHPFSHRAVVLGTITKDGYAWHILDLRRNVTR